MAISLAKGNPSSVDLGIGVTSSGIQNIYEQSSTKKQNGELKEFRDKDGKIFAVYKVVDGCDLSFEALISSSVADKAIGDEVTINNVKYYVTDWTVTESNQDAKKVSFTLRRYTDLEAGGSGSGTT